MMYTMEEKEKIRENVNAIIAYIQTLQPGLRDRITIDFGKWETYGWERERECHLTVYPNEICGRMGGLGIVFSEDEGSSLCASVYRWFGYTIQLIQNWPRIKQELLSEIEKQNQKLADIQNFTV